MTSKLFHNFTHNIYTVSTDYKLLWDKIIKGYRIPAWIVYSDKYEEPIWDLVEVKKPTHSTYSIGTRGIGYEGEQSFEGFEIVCKSYSLHFIIQE